MNKLSSKTRNTVLTQFYMVFFGQSFSLFGSQLVQFTLVWWLTKISGSASVLALASMMAILPQVLFGPFAGPLIDRWNRRIVLMVSDSFIALAIMILAILYTQGNVQVWHIYIVMFIRSIGGAFQWPAMQASTSLMVPKRHLSRVSGLNQAVFGLVNIIAPPLGALLIELFPIQNVLAIDVSTAIVAVGLLFFIKIPQPQRQDELESSYSSVLSDFREGLRYLWEWKGALIIVVIAMVINLLANPAFSLTPILVTRYFEGGAIELAWLQSAFGVGTVLGGIALGIWSGFKEQVKTGLMALILSGISMLVIGLTPKDLLIVAISANFSFGLMNSIANAIFLAVLQATVPSELQGRIFTLVSSATMSMSPLGLAIAGPVADVLGVLIWFLIAGSAIVVMGTTAFFMSSIMQIEKGLTN